MEKFDVSVILPIKSSSSPWFEEYFKKCIESIKTQKTQINELVIVHCDESSLIEFLNSFDFGDLNVVKHKWTDEPNYAKQINHGVRASSSEWISLFEFDDEYSTIWFKNVKNYVKYYPEVGAFLPIVVDIDEKGIFAGFTNEAVFALNISEEMGYLNNDTLQQFQNFQLSGM
jgi:glycosyltransferase involved in cell wall biosynthesis